MVDGKFVWVASGDIERQRTGWTTLSGCPSNVANSADRRWRAL